MRNGLLLYTGVFPGRMITNIVEISIIGFGSLLGFR